MQTCRDINYEKKHDKCPTQFHNTEHKLGTGNFGSAYEACCNDDCTYAMKVIEDPDDDEHIDTEVELQNLCAAHNYAVPVYETQKCQTDAREAFIMDRLDISLYDDLFSLSPIQNKQIQYTYKKHFAHYSKQFPSLYKEWSKLSSYTSLKQYNSLYRLLRSTVIKSNHKDQWEDVVPKRLHDSLYEKQRKLKCILFALNVLDGLHKIGVRHNDTNLNNFMRKQEQEQYVMIDFGMAYKSHSSTDQNPDIELFSKKLKQVVEVLDFYTVYSNGNDYVQKYPISVDYSYLVEAFPIIQSMATAEYFTINAIQEKVDAQLEEYIQTFLGRKKVKSSLRMRSLKKSRKEKSSTRRKQSYRSVHSARKV
jgi:serine/threonine protein kinase